MSACLNVACLTECPADCAAYVRCVSLYFESFAVEGVAICFLVVTNVAIKSFQRGSSASTTSCSEFMYVSACSWSAGTPFTCGRLGRGVGTV